MAEIIGRKSEQEVLRGLLESDESQFVALFGRRRVGKTFLIREFFRDIFAFHVTGAPNVSISEQLLIFSTALSRYGLKGDRRPQNWFEAFGMLSELLESLAGPSKKVIFIDEMPWMDSRRSRFVPALEHFWNSWAASRNDIILIACGSATSWMMKKILRNTGGLYNRVTMRMRLEPFTLSECEEYYTSKGMELSRYQILESYMILGGVPYYLSLMKPRLTLAQNIDNLFFAPSALLEGEYPILFEALFSNAGAHRKVIEALSSLKKGMTRSDLLAATKLSDGGSITRALEDLELCGFIRKYKGFSRKSRDVMYQLIDPFLLYHHTFITQNNDARFWEKYSISPGHAGWSGYAFELVCLLHVDKIKTCLGADYVVANVASWHSSSTKPGAQIDLVIDRSDGIVDLCEMKYLNDDYHMEATDSEGLRRKKTAFARETKTRKKLRLVLVTTYGLIRNKHSDQVQAVVTMDALF